MKRSIMFGLIVLVLFVGWGCDSNSVSDTYMQEQAQVGPTTTWNVPGDFATIQQAVDAAGHGDFIRVAAGIYSGDVVSEGKDLSLRGAGKDHTTIIGHVELFDSSEISVEGFTIRGGIHVKNSPARITGNRILNSAGAGVWIEQSVVSIISDNEMTGNAGEGLLYDDSTGVIGSNHVKHNGADGIVINNSSPTLENNIITLNGRDGISIRGFSGYAAPLLMSNASQLNGGESNYDIICFGHNTNPTGRGNAFDDCINCSECIMFDEQVTYQY